MKVFKFNKIIFFILFISTTTIFSQSVDSVRIQYEDMRCMPERPQEWQCEVYAYLYKNGQPVEHQDNYDYNWYEKKHEDNQFTINYGASGTGIKFSSRYEDGMYSDITSDNSWDNYVVVSGPDFTVTSRILNVGKVGSAHKVKLIAKDQNGSNLDQLEYFYEYTNPRWEGKYFAGEEVYLFLDESRTLWTNTRVVNDIKEKFYQWSAEDEPFINYHNFKIYSTTSEIETNTQSVCSASLQTELISGGGGVTIGLKDPWYADGAELCGIKQNRGANALWHDYEQLDIAANSDDDYKGVIKELTDQDPLYYSIRAPKKQSVATGSKVVNHFFTNWRTNDQVSITQPDHTEFFGDSEYYTNPVIFHGDNAQITAVYKGHLASSVARATGYNNGRRVTKACGNMYLVYEDNGVVYYASSDDDGHSWTNEQPLSDNSPDENFTNPSITTYNNKLFAAWIGPGRL